MTRMRLNAWLSEAYDFVLPVYPVKSLARSPILNTYCKN